MNPYVPKVTTINTLLTHDQAIAQLHPFPPATAQCIILKQIVDIVEFHL